MDTLLGSMVTLTKLVLPLSVLSLPSSICPTAKRHVCSSKFVYDVEAKAFRSGK